MSYELHVNAGVAGTQQLEQLTRATDSQSGSTAKLNDALYGLKGATEKQTEAILKYQTQLAKTEEWTIRYKVAQMDAATATDRGTQSVDRMAAAHRHAITDVQAASGALRAMEGTIPIRAVEQFTTKVLGMGGAFQALFPAVGAVAALGVIDRMIDKAGELYNAWNPIIHAQKESLKILEESDRKFDSLISKANQLRLDTYERDHGRSARLRLEATEASGDAAYEDAARIRYIQARIAEQQGILNQRSSSGFALGSVRPVSESARAAAQEKLVGLGAQLEEAQLQQKVDLLRAKDLDARANEIGTKSAAREDAEDIRIQRELRAQANREFIKGLNELQKELEKTKVNFETINGPLAVGQSRTQLSPFGKIFDERLPNVKDESEKQVREAVQSLSVGRDRFGAILGPIEGPTPIGASGQQILRDVQMRGRRNQALYATQAQLAGVSPQDQIGGEYQLRMRQADEEYQAQVRIARAKRDIQAEEDALDQLVMKRYDASLEMEQKMLELALRQKQQFEQGMLGFLHAIASGNAGSFITGQLQKIAEQLLVKLVLGPIFDKLAGAAAPKTVSIGDVIGGAAKDQAEKTDLNTAATKDNTDALRDNTDALRALAMSPSGGGGSAGSPFVNYGFGGSGGIPGLGGGGLGGGLKGLSTFGKVASIAGAGFGVYEGVSSIAKGGGRNIAGGVSDIAMSAAMLDPEPISKMVLFGVGLVSGLIKGIFGDPKAERQAGITKALQTNQFMAPVALNASMSAGGGFSDYDRFGNVRDSSLSPFPTVQQGYFDARHDWTPVPGRVLNQFGGSGGGAPLIGQLNVSALDTKNILDRHADIGDAVARSLQLGSSGHLAETLTARGN